MKIGILTRRDGYNFGTSLQAYAIYRAIKRLENNVIVINYSEYSLKAKIKYIALSVMGKLHIPYNKSNIRYIQRKLFIEFDKLLDKTSSQFRYNIPDGWNDGFDKIVCGSDQIWNPAQKTDAFLLNFAPDYVSKIAYAPSIGLTDCIDKFTSNGLSLLKKFNHLSCRESNGCKLLSSMTGMNCHEVVDPTLLLDCSDWIKIEKPIDTPKSYLLTYFLGESKNYPDKAIHELAQRYNLEIINVCLPHYNDYPGILNMRCGPQEFLYLIHNASIICTNSYHGSVFSMIFNKLFYVFERRYNISGYNEHSRFDTLFASTPLTTVPLTSNLDELPYQHIDYAMINEVIQKKKEFSISYLQKSIYD